MWIIALFLAQKIGHVQDFLIRVVARRDQLQSLIVISGPVDNYESRLCNCLSIRTIALVLVRVCVWICNYAQYLRVGSA